MTPHSLILAACTVSALASSALAQCPARWIPVGDVALSTGTAAVNTLLPLPDNSGDILVGGTFDTVGPAANPTVALSIARFRPSTGEWFALSGLTITGTVRSLAALPDGDIIIAGTFSTSPGISANNIVRYHPADNTWPLLGTGTTNGLRGSYLSGGSSIQALAARPTGDIIAFGSFDTPGATWPVNNAAIWAPSTNTWSGLGSGFAECYPSDPDCPTLLVHGSPSVAQTPSGNIIRGGNFVYTSGIYAYHLALLDPTNTWSSPVSTLGTAINGPVSALAVLPSGDVIIGGAFTSAGGVAAIHCVRWSPIASTWSPMSTSTAQTITTLMYAPGRNLYAGTSGSPCQILRWNEAAAAWTLVVASATDFTTITAMAALPGGDLLIAGRFSTIPGGPTVHLARLTTLPTCPADFNCSGILEVQDIFDFLNAWLAADPRADFNSAGGLNNQDIFDYLNAWFAGC
jgi:hypothetical protein